MTESRKCQICKEHDSVWIMQFVAEDEPTFTRPGYHYRGFAIIKICGQCKLEREIQDIMKKTYEIISRMPPIRYEVNDQVGRKITII